MIARQLRRIPYYASPRESQILEAFAFCYAAGYCNGTISNRMKESYQRAWDFDQWSFIPDITLGPPGAVVVRWEGNYRPKLVVALRGISSWAQLIPIRSGFGSVAMPDYGGSVYAPFKSGADLMYTALMANSLFTAFYNTQAIPMVVTGHSMGAAIAEILAARFREEKPGKDVRLIKFASPRVGTSEWVRYNTYSRDFQSVYIRPDPINQFPWQSLPRTSIGLGTPIPSWSEFVPDLFTTLYSYYGEPTGNYQYRPREMARSLTELTAWPPASTNPWYAHLPSSYRYALTGLSHAENSWWKWRFRYLEHTDEDRWGADYRQQMSSWAPLMALGAANPPDVTVELPEQEFTDYARPRLQEAVANDFWWQGGGTWSPPAVPPLRQRVHYPRP